ncbi:hypothetical protein PCASD_14292 [Puccinia coronata f. sp. avenae]|uniref:Uncharacterized protein n=1 Tax=Puccinia coronata f. sp. avenae TaxID=200324 RepID=A0A2N5U9H8_9BASI|nr:hypothetical protein PCASD_24750 [Puccinia coronata f. sp. avenae]PLW34399.1 hypothetical protein PCASD_14292 [Puccinia coronata f. sp. avenae]
MASVRGSSDGFLGKMLATQPDLSALLSSVPQPLSLCPSTFYFPCKLVGLKRSLSGPDLINKLGPDHQLSPGYDRTIIVGAPSPVSPRYHELLGNDVPALNPLASIGDESYANGWTDAPKRGKGDHPEFSCYQTNPLAPCGLNGQLIAFGERQQSKRVRLEQSITTGNHGQDSWSNPSNAHFNAFPKYFTPVEDEQAISVSQVHQSRKMHIEPFIPTGNHVQDYWSNPSIFHSKSVQWSHAHIPSGQKPYVKPEEILNYPKDHLGTPDISSAATFPNTLEPPWPAESYFDLQDPEWWEKLLTPLQDLIAHDGGHEKINSEKLKEAFSNPFSNLRHPEKDDGTADSFFNSDSQSLMTAAHVPHTDLNPPYGFAKSLKADYSGSSDFHWPKSSSYPEETRGLEVNWHRGL